MFSAFQHLSFSAFVLKFLKCVGMFVHPLADVLHDAADIAFGSPRCAREKFRAIAEEQAQVGRAVRRHAGDGNPSMGGDSNIAGTALPDDTSHSRHAPAFTVNHHGARE